MAGLLICCVASVATAQEKTESIWVKADEMMAKEKYEEAAKLYSIAIEMNAGDPDIYFAYFHRAEALLALGKVDEALADYTETIKLNPRFKEAYRMQGHHLR